VTAVSRDPRAGEHGGGEHGDPADLDPADEAYVRSILALYAEADPIPGHVAERLELALAAAAEDADLVTAGSVVSPLRRKTHQAATRGQLAGPARRLLVAAAAVTVLVGGVSLTYVNRGTEEAATSTAGAAPQSGAEGLGDEQSGAESDAAAPAGQDTAAGSGGPTPATITTSGRDYSASSLPAAASQLLPASPDVLAPAPEAGTPDRAARPDGPLVVAPPAPALDRLRDAMTLGICARALADGGSGEVLAADLARSPGQPAALLVLPGPDTTVVDVWVVGPGCAPGDEQVLARARVPR
jgi:hypothetical protein